MTGLTHPAAGSAVLSPCGAYRCLLTRRLGRGAKLATFVMLNPSTADAESDDRAGNGALTCCTSREWAGQPPSPATEVGRPSLLASSVSGEWTPVNRSLPE